MTESITPGPGTGTVVSVNLSAKKTVRKTPGTHGTLVLDRGFEGDAHAGDWHRQVSLLAEESIHTMVEKGLDVGAGDFAENITTRGIDLMALPVGSVLKIGEAVVLEISQIGKVCHTKCAIYYQAGDCVMPREGLFAVVRQPGEVKTGDVVEVVSLGDGTCDRTPESAVREFAEERAKEEALKQRAAELGLEPSPTPDREGFFFMSALRIGLLTTSDTRTREQDTAGAALHVLCEERGWEVAVYHLVPDDPERISEMLVGMADLDACDIVLTAGGTGLGPRDSTPEATARSLRKDRPRHSRGDPRRESQDH